MKKALLVQLFFFTFLSLSAQETGVDSNRVTKPRPLPGTQEYYLNLSDNHRKVGNILFVSGALSVAAGFIYSSSETSEGLDIDFTSPALILGGLVGMGLSAVFFAQSAKKARLAVKYARSELFLGAPLSVKGITGKGLFCSIKIPMFHEHKNR